MNWLSTVALFAFCLASISIQAQELWPIVPFDIEELSQKQLAKYPARFKTEYAYLCKDEACGAARFTTSLTGWIIDGSTRHAVSGVCGMDVIPDVTYAARIEKPHLIKACHA